MAEVLPSGPHLNFSVTDSVMARKAHEFKRLWTLQTWGFFFFFFLVFRDRVSLYNPGCPGTPPASASRALGLKGCATTPG